MLRFLISFLLVCCMFLLSVLSVYSSKCFHTSYMPIYIFTVSIFTVHLIMTEVRSKGRLLALIFIVKSFKKPL